jgi:hypothetical protein
METHWNDEVRQAAERVRFLPLRLSAKGRGEKRQQAVQQQAVQQQAQLRQQQVVAQANSPRQSAPPVTAAAAYHDVQPQAVQILSQKMMTLVGSSKSKEAGGKEA